MDLLLVTLGSAGDVHPFVGLGRALRGRGHRVSVLTYPAFADLIQSAGLDYLCLPRPQRAPHSGAGRLFDSAVKVFDRRWRRLARRSTILPHLRPVYEGIARHAIPGETVVVAHHPALGARVAHDHLGTPLVSVHLAPAALRSACAPSVQPPLDFPPWAPRWYVRATYWLLDVAVIDRVLGEPVNDFRRELGLAPVGRLYGRWKESPQRVIGLFPEWFAPPQPDWPAQTRLTGFPLFDGLGGEAPAAAVEEFLGAARPVILTATSEARNSRRHFEQGVAACLRLRQKALLLTRFREQVPEPLPEGFRWANYARFSQVLPRAAAVVHHGGIGTAAQALAAGIPQLIVPLRNDQFDNARRLERLGVARVSSRRDCTTAVLTHHLDYLLTSPEVAERCRDFAGRLAATDALGEACRLIEAMRPPRAGAA
jgi:UDP:flavonoid glycosyltransferase YjiC (YdhE family)